MLILYIAHESNNDRKSMNKDSLKGAETNYIFLQIVKLVNIENHLKVINVVKPYSLINLM